MLWQKKQPAPQPTIQPRSGIFSTDPEPMSALQDFTRRQMVLARTFQRGAESLKPVDAAGAAVAMDSAVSEVMDGAYPNLMSTRSVNNLSGWIPFQQMEWYASQGFIGWQTCAILAQNWLIDKACGVPAQDAIRHGWELSATDGLDIDSEIFDAMKRLDKKYKIKRQCREFVKHARIFGIRHAMFLVDGIDYELPFNPDGVRPGSYKGITQIDPYWIAPVLDQRAAIDFAAPDFYEPTWWIVNGKRVHRSHMVIMRNGDEVVDILKPSYFYGGIPIPQKIFERVYAAERTANEAPMLAMTKRMIVLKVDMAEAWKDMESFTQKMMQWLAVQNNFGARMIDKEDEEISQFETSLTSLDETIMTQYQLVAAASNVPATKLLGTSPKGFNATGEYEEASYHEELESIQEHDLTPLLDRHHLLCIRSEIAPMFNIEPFNVEVVWKPTDSPTAKEAAEINKAKADTDNALVTAGAIDGFDVRQRLINDPDSGYNGIASVVPDGPGDREAQQEAEAQLEQPVQGKPARASANTESQEK